MTTLKEDLLAVKALIGTPETWTQKTLARTRANYLCSPTDEEACRWCLAGAVVKVCGISGKREIDAMCHLTNTIDAHSDKFSPIIAAVNDSQGFDTVHKLLDLAIGTAE